MNDNFEISCIFDFENTLEIFNRWGQLVYQTENYQNDWMATDRRGNDLPQGAYFYVLVVKHPDGTSEQSKGHITVLRDE